MNISQNGLDLIKKFEGCSLKSYKCPAGILTIGYGHTGNVKENQTITISQAEELLKKDAQRFVDGVNGLLKVSVNQNQFDALVSFAYNLGLGALQRSQLIDFVNAKKFSDTANEFLKWNKAGGKVLNGLINRRMAEKSLFEEAPKVSEYQLTEQDKKVIAELQKLGITDGKNPTRPVTQLYLWHVVYNVLHK